MQERISPDGLHDDAGLWDFTHGSIDLLFKIVYEFGSYILAADKPARVINIPERYIIDELCTDIDLDTVKGVKQQSPESGIKLIKVIDTFECSTRFQLMVAVFQAWEFYLVRERIESEPVITDIKENLFGFLLVVKHHTVCFQSGNLLVYRICFLHRCFNPNAKLFIFREHTPFMCIDL